jgi:hypothetical protein
VVVFVSERMIDWRFDATQGMLVNMKLQNALSVSLLFAFAACAGQTYRVDAGPMFVRARGEFALADPTQVMPPGNSLDGNLGLGGNEVSPYIGFRTDIDKHRVRVNGFYLDTEGSGTLGTGGPTGSSHGDITPGTDVQASMDFFAIVSNYSYEVWRRDYYRVAVGAQLGFYSLDVTVRATDGPGREEVTSEVMVPMPYVEAEAYWRDFTFGTNMGIMAADLGDANGRYIDFEAYASWAINQSYDLKASYRYILLDGYGRASSRDFDADVDVQGLHISGGIRF